MLTLCTGTCQYLFYEKLIPHRDAKESAKIWHNTAYRLIFFTAAAEVVSGAKVDHASPSFDTPDLERRVV